MGIRASLEVVAALAEQVAPSLVDLVVGRLDRERVDQRTRAFGRDVVELLDIDLHVAGIANVPAEAAVYMSNHQSHLDIPVLYAALPAMTLRMVAKAELFKIPLWGQALRGAEFIEVHRGDHQAAMVAMAHAEQLVSDGVNVWLAPEGTRSRDGRVGPLKKGGFHLAIATKAPIVPVAVRGTLDILPRGGIRARRGCRVDVVIGSPLPTLGRSVAELVEEVGKFLRANVEGDGRPAGL